MVCRCRTCPSHNGQPMWNIDYTYRLWPTYISQSKLDIGHLPSTVSTHGSFDVGYRLPKSSIACTYLSTDVRVTWPHCLWSAHFGQQRCICLPVYIVACTCKTSDIAYDEIDKGPVDNMRMSMSYKNQMSVKLPYCRTTYSSISIIYHHSFKLTWFFHTYLITFKIRMILKKNWFVQIRILSLLLNV